MFQLRSIVLVLLALAVSYYTVVCTHTLQRREKTIHSASLPFHGGESTRIYKATNGKVVEHGNDGIGWYVGALPQPSGESVAATYIGSGVRVYVSLNGTIIDYCYDFSTAGWYVGGFSGTKGKLLSLSASVSGSSLKDIYVYGEENNSTLQYTYTPSSGWNSPLTLSF
jgi:hypothetical protein